MKQIKASAPGRCGIIGNPTDGYGGTVISCTLDKRAFAEIRPHDCLRLIVAEKEIILRSPEDFELNGDYFDIPKSVIKYLDLTDCKLELRCWSDIPMQGGLAGSTAAMAALFGALSAYKNQNQNPYMVSEKLHEIEQKLLKIRCGFQDHYMVVFGGINYMDFRMKEDCQFIDKGVFATIEPLTPYVGKLPFILAHTGKKHHSGNVHGPIRERWLQGDPQVREGYKSIGRFARMGKKALLNQDWKELGRLMIQNHEIQRDLGGSGDVNEALIRVALEAGAEGAKLAGAGQGGTIIALATNLQPVINALKNAGAQDILFPKPDQGLSVEILD